MYNTFFVIVSGLRRFATIGSRTEIVREALMYIDAYESLSRRTVASTRLAATLPTGPQSCQRHFEDCRLFTAAAASQAGGYRLDSTGATQ